MSMAGGHLQKAYSTRRRSLTVIPLGKLRGRTQQLMETGIRLIATCSPAWLLCSPLEEQYVLPVYRAPYRARCGIIR